MGYVKHELVTFTSYDAKKLRAVRKNATTMFWAGQVSSVSTSAVNGYYTFVIFPHGSKAGWQDETDWHTAFDELMEHIEATYADSDGDLPFNWAHLTYGGDDSNVKVVTDKLTVTASETN